jgi:hypothetical protein
MNRRVTKALGKKLQDKVLSNFVVCSIIWHSQVSGHNKISPPHMIESNIIKKKPGEIMIRACIVL